MARFGWKHLFQRRRATVNIKMPPARFIMTEDCIVALSECLSQSEKRGHEGIAYLLGLTNARTSMAVAAIRPDAQTSRGHFHVDQIAMARIMRKASDAGLQIVGQVHTHPGDAYHSQGDIEGAKIAYTGFTSMVLPNYGRELPNLDGAAAYMFASDTGFVPIDETNISVLAGNLT